MTAVTICSDFRAQEEEICHYFHLFPFIRHEVVSPDASHNLPKMTTKE